MQQRRAHLVSRHALTGEAEGPEAVVRAVVALHASDPATVYLSVLARSRTTSIEDISAAMYGRRALVRWMAMRRTLFVFARNDIPVIQAAVSNPLSVTLRRRLLSLIRRNGIEPTVDEDLADWLAATEERVEHALRERGTATATQLRSDEPALLATIPSRTRSEISQRLTSPLLTLMSTEGRLVRGSPVGAWTTRTHHWESATKWWPEGLPRLDPAAAQTSLARRWLERFGPATVEDLRWWTGWSMSTTRSALSRLDIEDIDLHGGAGIALADTELAEPAEPVVCLLPSLDPTPMGWRHRDWFTAVDPALVYDSAGNIGPTVWWDGALIGSWASTPTGIRTKIVADRGAQAAAEVERAAAHLHQRLNGDVITPAARTPLERQLSSGL